MVAVWSTSVFSEDLVKEREQAYYDALSEYFEVSLDAIAGLQEQGVAIEELPVLILLADRAEIPVDKIGKNRAGGTSLMSITEECGLGANEFYIIFGAKFSSETYSPIFEKYRHVESAQEADVQFTDDEIVNLVNLKFISSVHDYSIFEVMAKRDIVNDFPRINELVKQAKAEMMAREEAEEKEKRKKAKQEDSKQ
jgi:hypothetical protein